MPVRLDPLPLVISIQSQVAFGHVGNSAAAFAMRAAGVEVVEIPTTLLSNHPRYPTTRGRVLEPELVADLLRGVAERDLPARTAVILSGFMGRAGTAQAVANFVRQARQANPQLRYLCDPVMGDCDLGFFAAEDLRAAFASTLVPLADVILPNAFELEALSGTAINRAHDVETARQRLGLPAVIATSVPAAGRSSDLAVVVAEAAGVVTTEVPRLPVRPMGTGDLLAGLVAARVARGVPLAEAAAQATAGVAAVLAHTAPEHGAEMPIEACITEILAARC